ncbi:hypothetical protein [Mucilaginibacter ginsenosidivorax]|uniref:Uncharacterized protein n=1 Tax=Mucilaginibacter ginsenosidivorax TaxID=862126 RepID=A0A5B8W6V8_9SPHI|nr:hypothetical protein [Mucilaginibacter ginsenosidivorax]QEC79349.1 hypothetical protein FSB76_26620 [Mucilaginibacter ginsenosidivorax]
MTNIHKTMCEECNKLVGASRHTQPHGDLKLTKEKPFKSMFGDVNEYYYTCNECGTEWLREKGSYGQGWQR